MKKISLIFAFVLFFLTSNAEAKTIKVVSLQYFSTAYPIDTYNVQTLKKADLGNGIVLQVGTIISGQVVKVIPPKRGKRNAYFVFAPTLLTYNGVSRKVEDKEYVAKIIGYTPIDPQKAALYLSKKAADLALKGASLGISFVQGVNEAEEGEKIKGGIVRVYKDSPLSFIEEGAELNIGIGDTLILKIKNTR